MKFTFTSIAILLSLRCSAFAVEYPNKHQVSVRQISHQFPFTLDFNGIKAAFAEPKLVLDVLEQTIVNQLPDIRLVDFTFLTTPLTSEAAKGLLIKSRHVQLIF
jgi:hypothetical protein